MKKFVSIMLFFLLTISSFSLSGFALEKTTMSREKFYNQAKKLVLDYESSGGLGSDSTNKYQTNRLIVKTEDNEPLENHYGAWGIVEGYNGMHILQYTNEAKAKSAYNKLSLDNIEYIEYDFYIKIDGEGFTSQEVSDMPLSTRSHLSWNSTAVDVDEATEYIKSQNSELSSVTVAIVDSGLYAAHDFFCNSNRIIDSEYIYETWEQDDDYNDILVRYSSMDATLFHGTHIAGTIFDNTSENIKIMPFRATNYMDILYLDLINAFEAAIDKADPKPDIINISAYKSSRNDEKKEYSENQWITLYNLVTKAVDNNITVVVCAGNKEGDAGKYYPACHPDVITVASSDENNLPDYERSNKGSVVDVAAPGTNIRSTSTIEKIEVNPEIGSFYLTDSGTSYATALVSAAAATLKSIHPEYTPADIQRIIKETAYVPEVWDTDYGVGIVNFLNMVKAEATEVKPTIAAKNGKIEITAPKGSDSRIYYTLDGTVPTIDNPLTYSEPFSIVGKNVAKITAVCHENGKLIGEPVVFETTRRININLHYKHIANPMPKDLAVKATWKSSNPEVAAVDSSGNIIGKSVGETNIFAYYPDGTQFIYRITVDYALWQKIIINLFFGFHWYI